MDYEKKYDDLMAKIEAVKKDPKIGLKDGDYYNGYVQKGIRSALDYLLQEESEDERIINQIISLIKEVQEDEDWHVGKWSDDAIDWLEKQKEHQNNSDAPNESSWTGIISSSDKDSNLDEIAQEYIDGVKQYNPTPTWDLMQTAVCYGYHLGANHQVLDDEHLLSAIQVHFASHAKVENGKRYAKLTWDEFKKIVFELCSRCKQKEQQPAEWSKEDEKLLDLWLDVIDRNDWRMDENFCKALREFVNRVKSLRPQPHWKPGEEQIEALTYATGEGGKYN